MEPAFPHDVEDVLNVCFAIGLVALVGQTTACRRARSAPDRNAAPPTELVVAVDSEPKDGFDPLMGWGRYGSPIFHSTLLRRDHDQRLVPDLATAAELSADRLTWNIGIREDAAFHDGHPVTADDVVFTFREAARSAGKTDVSVLKEAKATSRYSLELVLREPQITFANRLATLGIVPAHAYGPGYGRHPIGSGPYRFVRWDEGRQLVLEANDGYYGPKPSIRRVVAMFLEEDAAFASARAGTVQVVRVPAALASRPVHGMRIVRVESVDNRGISFPCVPHRRSSTLPEKDEGNDVTSDLALRRAANLAVDRRALVKGVLDGFGAPAFGPISHTPWEEPEAAVSDANPAQARAILADSGWLDADGDGVLEKNGTKAEFDLLYPADDLTRQGLAMAVADMLRPIGIRVRVVSKSWEAIYRRMHSDAVLFGFGSLDQTEMHHLFHSGLGGEPGHNPGLFSNAKVDEYLDRAMGAHSQSEAIDLWRRAQWDGATGFSARGDAPWVWLVNLDHVYLADERLDTGTPDIEQHGTTLLANVAQWQWKQGR